MKKMTFAVTTLLISMSVNATFYPGFVNKKQCVYFKDNASQRSDCTNSNTTCHSDGRCTVTLADVAYDGDVDTLIILQRAEHKFELESHYFGEEDFVDLRDSKLTPSQVLIE